ncbi:hypothetical protein [Streptomyces shenzhenensis]|uniref:hypothetical protein n=1 Tax=Streptomyces shenzhenensis TaxID=943815 RepID=UPI001F3ECA8B|nr:hypothetical protein [Streptomyces shenzhenensis]
MGYEFHITRAESWTDSQDSPISRDEWESLAESREALKNQGFVEWKDIGPQPVYALTDSSASFSWRHGRVDVTGHMSDEEWELAESLAAALEARLVGDDE